MKNFADEVKENAKKAKIEDSQLKHKLISSDKSNKFLRQKTQSLTQKLSEKSKQIDLLQE